MVLQLTGLKDTLEAFRHTIMARFDINMRRTIYSKELDWQGKVLVLRILLQGSKAMRDMIVNLNYRAWTYIFAFLAAFPDVPFSDFLL
jgi:hypothetical protein